LIPSSADAILNCIQEAKLNTVLQSISSSNPGLLAAAAGMVDGKPSPHQVLDVPRGRSVRLDSDQAGPSSSSIKTNERPSYSRPTSPRLHSLPDNTLNALGLLAECVIHLLSLCLAVVCNLTHSRVGLLSRTEESTDGWIQKRLVAATVTPAAVVARALKVPRTSVRENLAWPIGRTFSLALWRVSSVLIIPPKASGGTGLTFDRNSLAASKAGD
jgi:hypothetical protein